MQNTRITRILKLMEMVRNVIARNEVLCAGAWGQNNLFCLLRNFYFKITGKDASVPMDQLMKQMKP